jgi:hypothetical protein
MGYYSVNAVYNIQTCIYEFHGHGVSLERSELRTAASDVRNGQVPEASFPWLANNFLFGAYRKVDDAMGTPGSTWD